MEVVLDNTSNSLGNHNFKWMRVALWYKRTPLLKHISPMAFPAVFVSLMLVAIFPQNHCKCEDQISDKSILLLARKGDREAIRYLKARDYILLCASRRQQLLKKLEKQKKLKYHRPKT